ncbi:hypothetical protein QO000_002640 [Alkalihalobacillus hemicentroti]|uniref:Uncharacterized protein n=1 Tax=Guptibacillus hwajinpoensis TaxID=208199 RepID=A0ABU0K2S2_9BACL|nr:hypothetical protein [Alkalihalobacillus hemicentroti]
MQKVALNSNQAKLSKRKLKNLGDKESILKEKRIDIGLHKHFYFHRFYARIHLVVNGPDFYES